jgi:hypothetical protein
MNEIVGGNVATAGDQIREGVRNAITGEWIVPGPASQ